MLISFAVTAKLIFAFVFAYARTRLSHNAAQIEQAASWENLLYANKMWTAKAGQNRQMHRLICRGLEHVCFCWFFRITCPCVISPITPHFYIVIGGIHYFLIFALKHILWVLVRTCNHNYCFEQKYEKSKKKNQLKIVIFTAVKNCCILHGRLFIMLCFL